ncbi:MAG: LuxR C-terminal-related transcriptional regulator, partial [Gemmobacter sp.]|nr:LuxR C-terminal-related transcriptional regulator [Gemmobacter sp.]
SASLQKLAPSGFYLALRVGFYTPSQEMNTFPDAWIEFYTSRALAIEDPYLRWTQIGDGIRPWSALSSERTNLVQQAYRDFGLLYGATGCIPPDPERRTRSYGLFARQDRDFLPEELEELMQILRSLHSGDTRALTQAQIEVLRMMAQGHTQKVISHELGISVSAIKERLKGAARKLDTKSTRQTLTVAAELGLI